MRNFKILITISVVAISLLVGAGFFYRQGFQVKRGNGAESVGQPIEAGKGIVEGTVYSVGALCNPNQEYYKVPSCDGQYPNYETVFYKDDKKTVAGRAVTNDKGFYRIELASGSYYILVGSGPFGKQGDVLVTVKSGETTVQDIIIDTGIR